MKPVVAHKKEIPLYSRLPSDVMKEVRDFMTKIEKGLYQLFQCAAFRQATAEKSPRKEVRVKEIKVKKGRVHRVAKKKSAAA